jgi:alpha-mannosidase
MRIDWALPQGRSKDDNARSEVLKPFPIDSVVTLRKGQPWVEIETTVDNTVEDHYLQAVFPTGVETDRLDVQGQFDVVDRSFKTPSFDEFDDPPQAEFPMNSFVDASDGKRGLAILNDGLKAYIADEDPARTVRMTLLRCFPLRIIATSRMIDYSQTDKGSQCPGRHTFRYALMPHKGGWAEGNVWNAATQFTTPLRACQVGPTKHGTEPLAKSFLELKAEGLHVSAVKESESGEGWIVRLFNSAGRQRKGQIRLNGGYTGPEATQSPIERVQQEFALPQGRGSKWRTVRTTTLEEIPQKNLEVDENGWASFSIGKKQILTIEFVK